ncbi:putative ATP-dependent RNA helicase DHX35 [Lycorma delicatula]|uniref:putative ATP-dependent RNA helicase DHX35 n=1 Tax=Lycorma delicatula TaxID=130591 RepID=UPI003F50E8E2
MSVKSIKHAFLKPGEAAIWEEDKSDVEPSQGTRFIFNPNISLALELQRQRLPVYHKKAELLYLVETYQTLVLVGETGCGKSTQIPQYLREAGWCQNDKVIGITEPRRVAATTLATRVAEECGTFLGLEVGYSIRFDDCFDPAVTKIKYMTEGMLMREMMADPLLRSYSVIILDEVHERTLFTDILMGLLKKILRKRKDLRLAITSATVDAEGLKDFFNHGTKKDKSKDTSVIMSIEGRVYPVEIFYSKEPVPDYVKGVVDTALKIHEKEASGDILAFLTGQEEVDRAVSLLKDHIESSKRNDGLKLVILPMYGALPNSEQLKVFQTVQRNQRKIVIATNIAETSVTIPGIVYVIDSGFVKMQWFNPNTWTNSLVIVPISKASAEQRAGRAGRIKSGKVFRLYTEDDYKKLPENSPPEMQRSDLSGAVLQLKALGINNVLRFSFPSPPPARNLLAALELLHALGVLSDDGSLTRPLGIQMAEFPLSPLHAKALLVSGDMGCSDEIASILSLLQVQSVFIRPSSGSAAIKARIERRKFEVSEGDLLTLLNVYNAYKTVPDTQSKSWCHNHFVNHRALRRVTEIRTQMLKLLHKLKVSVVSCDGDTKKVCRAITAGFFPNAAYLHHSGVYHSIRGEKQLYIHPGSVLYTLEQPQWLLFCEISQTDKIYMRECTSVDPSWLEELAPHFYHKTFDQSC